MIFMLLGLSADDTQMFIISDNGCEPRYQPPAVYLIHRY